MISMKVSELMGGMFVRVLKKIAGTPNDPYAAYRIRNASRAIQEMQGKTRFQYKEEIQGKYAERDESGAVILDETGTGFKANDTKGFDEASIAFGERKVDIDAKKIRFEDLAKIQLSPAELEILSPILDEPKNQE